MMWVAAVITKTIIAIFKFVFFIDLDNGKRQWVKRSNKGSLIILKCTHEINSRFKEEIHLSSGR